MARRTLTLFLACLLAVVLSGGAALVDVPYVALGPGPTYNTTGEVDGKPVIAIEGVKTFPTDGHLDLTTVGVQDRLTLVDALRGWFDGTVAVVPREAVYRPGQTNEQVEAENTELMQTSQNSATTAAARQLGYQISTITVQELVADSPAAGKLQVDDVVTTVDGTKLRDAAELQALVSDGAVGQVLEVGYRRDGRPGTTSITTGYAPGDAVRRPVIGVRFSEEPTDLPFDVDITLEEVGGPSAGLMFTLGIIDKLGASSLTGGTYVAGTGEISSAGVVGQIGGITQKLIAASGKGAVTFLVPAANCAEAVVDPPEGLALVKVDDLAGALAGLEALRRGGEPTLCA